MRVIFLTHTYPRWSGDVSGAALAALARALVRRGISVRVVAPGEETGGRAEVDGIPIRRVPVPTRLLQIISDEETFAKALRRPSGWRSLLRLWRALQSATRQELAASADLVHAHWWIPAGLASPPGRPVVLTISGADAALLKRSRLARALARPLFRRTAVLTADSRQAGESAQTLAGRFVGAEHIHPMPLDTREQPWTRGGGGLVVIGRLDRLGRVDLALDTVAVLASCGHHLPLTVIGDGPHLSSLQRQAQRLGVSTLVRFLAPLPGDQTRAHLARADLLLFTAQAEATSRPALEALITGVPVVACWDSGAVVDVVPQSGAGRLSLPSAESLADSVLSIQGDNDRLAIGRLVGEAWRARLAPDHVAGVCEGWYRDALSR